MTAKQLPSHPNLDQLKRQAKELLRSARRDEPGARARFRVLPAFASVVPDALARHPLALHDAQSVIAREHGFDSWKALVERIEELTLEFADAVDAFLEAATDRRTDRAERILALHPGIAHANLHAALVLGDFELVNALLDVDPALATTPGGPRAWQPLHYVCFTCVGARTPAREAGLIRIARRLIALGADPNLRFPWRHHDVFRPVLWGAVLVVQSLALARALLEAGANPNDGVTLTLAASMHDVSALELLQEFGVNPDGPWATDGSAALYAILHWADTDEGARWLVEHGADPDPVFESTGETPLHLVAARWSADLAELLVRHGADPSRQRADGRAPYAIALMSGNAGVAEWLRTHGGSADVSDVDRLVGACSRGDLASAKAMLEAHPELTDEIAPEHYLALYAAAERNDVLALEAMLTCGFDPNRGDDAMAMTALHKAAMAGWPDAVRVLLAHGASVEVRDAEFKSTPLVAAAEASRWHKGEGRDHAAVGRLLLDAGSPVDWEPTAEPTEGIIEILEAWRNV